MFYQMNIENPPTIETAPNGTCIARWEDDGGGPDPIALADRSPGPKARRIGGLPPARSLRHRAKHVCFEKANH
ncbi:hypothetical protein [Limimaricola litoreus]|uniref:Uncharacterized protein n=1 Tax=Limimaricola litoreus TaxID=2955316 RepID=A0A9X2FW34_9RHOB|nr:hypothetical protein [Limimaricola litoreus]MCP1169521.1 hypothetical protein [Limimaricola litoreus]